MSETIRIAQQMKQGFEKDCWSGPSLLEVLDGVDHKMASAKPIPNAHTIWEIVMHLIAGQSLMLRMVQGDIAQRVAVGDWWYDVPKPTKANWTATLARLKKQEKELQKAVAKFPDDRLETPLVEGGRSAYNNLHGHVQHTLYHAGQILMLKKALGTKQQ